MASLDAFLPLVRGPLPGCPETVLRDAIRDACIEFCKRAQLLFQEVAFETQPYESRVELYPDSDSLWEIVQLRDEVASLLPSNWMEFRQFGYDTKVGTPIRYYLAGDNRLVLGPTPNTVKTLMATVTVRPKSTATRVPDVLWDEYREPIAAGTRAWVRRHYGEWANPQLETYDRTFFEREIHNTQIRQARGGAGVALRVRAHPF